MIDSEDNKVFEAARLCFRDPTACGGLGLTSVACKRVPAFYTASAHSLLFMCSTPALKRALELSNTADVSVTSVSFWENPRSFKNYLTWEFADAQEVLLQQGCVMQLRQSQMLCGARPVLPRFPAVLGLEFAQDGSKVTIPPQKMLTKTYVPNVRRCAEAPLSETQTSVGSSHSAAV